MKTYKELLSITASLLGVSAEKAAEFFGNEGEEAPDEAAGISLNKTNLENKRKEGHNSGLALGIKNVSKAIEAELEISISGKTPEEIVSSIKTGLDEKSPSDLDEEAVKKSEPYKELEKKLAKNEQNINKAVEKKVKEITAEKDKETEAKIREANRKSTSVALTKKAEEWLEEKGAVLPEDKTKRALLIKELVKKLDEYDVDEDGDDFTFIKGGENKTRADGHNAKAADVFAEYDYLFTFQTGKQRKSPGQNPNPTPTPGEFKHFKGDAPKTIAERNKIQADFLDGKLSKEAYAEVKPLFAELTA